MKMLNNKYLTENWVHQVTAGSQRNITFAGIHAYVDCQQCSSAEFAVSVTGFRHDYSKHNNTYGIYNE